MPDTETGQDKETAKARKTRKAQPDDLKSLSESEVLDALLGPKEVKEGRSIGLTGRLAVFSG